jgi:hypothetical protein
MNTGLRFLAVLSVAVLASACGKDDKADSPAVPDPVKVDNPAPVSRPAPKAAQGVMSEIWDVPPMISFDINDIPVTDKNLGEFPFFAPPKGYRYVTPSRTALDEGISLKEPSHHLYAFGVDRVLKIDGKVLRVALHNDKLKSPSQKDFLQIRRYYKDIILAAGGVAVFDGSNEETYGLPSPEEYRKPAFPRSKRQIYVIHAKDMEAWFDIDCNSFAYCLFTVTQKGKM